MYKYEEMRISTQETQGIRCKQKHRKYEEIETCIKKCKEITMKYKETNTPHIRIKCK